MKCPFCHQDNDRVINTRPSEDGYVVRRRRICACGLRFTTYEQIELTHVHVVKRDGQRVPFNREKLQRGLEKACWKRNISDEQITSLIAKVERDVDSSFDTEVQSRFIGEQVMHYLSELDQVAFIRFASVYQHFEDAGDFAAKVNEILNSNSKDDNEDDGELLPSVHAEEARALREARQRSKGR
jgi:transcriptional repressor NrdR